MEAGILVSLSLAVALCCITQPIAAQEGVPAPEPTCSLTSRIESNVSCVPYRNRSVVVEHELEITTRVDGVSVATRQCEAEVALSYSQRDTLARIDGEIVNETCGASSGDLVLAVRTADENGEHTTQEFTQGWARQNDQPVNFRVDHPIGENVDLVRVRALKLRCTCAEAPAGAETTDALPE